MAAEAFTPQGPVTGDAVELEIKSANIGQRIAAFLIDAIIQIVVFIILIVALVDFSRNGSMSSSLLTAILILLIIIPMVALPATVESLTHGRSVGKLALGLRVVRDDHGVIRPRQAIGRALIGFVELWSTGGAAAIVTCIMNKRGKRLGDLASGTLVVSDRVKLRWPAPMPMPPALARWATNADIAPLDPRVVLGARQYLLRRHQLSPMAAQTLSTQLANTLRAHVSPQPPVSTADELIMAIIAERGRRDRGRLAKHEGLRRRLFDSRPQSAGASSDQAEPRMHAGQR